MSETPENLPAAYFHSLTISDFRCFGPETQTLNLTDDNGSPANWTIILGENGTGKTTLLRLIIILSPYSDQKFMDGSYNPRIFSSLAIFNSLWIHFSLPSTASGKAVDVSMYVSDKSGTINRDNDGRLYEFNLHGAERYISGKGPFSKEKFHLEQALLCGYGASRRMSNRPLSDLRTEESFGSLFDDNAELVNAEEWLVQTDYATKTGTESQKKRARERYERIKTIFVGKGIGSGLLPDVEDFRFLVTDNNAMTPQVEALTPYGWVRVRDLSLGYQAALTWIVDFASRLLERYPDSPNPLAEPAICLVDEIDLHLHPRWQRELLRVLSETFPQTQFIVTAHSPLIVQAAPDANLVLLRREGDHVVIENDVDYIRKWRVDQILASELFGEVSVHHPEVEKKLERRTVLTGKRRLTKAEREELTVLDAELDRLPTAVLPEDREAMDIIREAAELLRTK